MQYRAARQMIFEAYQYQPGSIIAGAIEKARIGADVQLTERNTSDARICHGLEAGMVISRVERLPQHLHALVLYLFGPFTREELAGDRELIERALYRAMIADGCKPPTRGQGSKHAGAEDYATLRHVCAAALHHHSEVTSPYSRPGLRTPKHIARWLADERGIELDTRYWARTWGDVWRAVRTILDDWERDGLAPVAALIPAPEKIPCMGT